MARMKSAASAMQVMAMFALALPAPVTAEDEQKTVIDGRCQYTDRVARHRNETTLIVCDTLTIGRSAPIATLDFSERSWGSRAQFSGEMSGDKMTVSQVTLRDGRTLAAKGSCELFNRNDGTLAVISCLAKADSRFVAANFIPSRI